MSDAVAECLTYQHLRSLGFRDHVPTYSSHCLRYDFGSFALEAALMFNRHFQEVVSLSGIIATPRTIGQIGHEMLPSIASIDEVAAHIGWALRNSTMQDNEIPEWLRKGTRDRPLLPWEQEGAAYAARPHCSADREWLKLALKSLADALQRVDTNAEQCVTWRFDGEILRISLGNMSIPVPATGEPWPSSYSVDANEMVNLPKRFSLPSVGISIWQRRLTLGNRQYPLGDAGTPTNL